MAGRSGAGRACTEAVAALNASGSAHRGLQLLPRPPARCRAANARCSCLPSPLPPLLAGMASPAWVTSRLVPQSTFSKTVYDVFFKRASSYMATVMVTATTVGIGYDYMMNFIWEKNNKGVRSFSPRATRRHVVSPCVPDAACACEPWHSAPAGKHRHSTELRAGKHALRLRRRAQPARSDGMRFSPLASQKLWKDIKDSKWMEG